MNDGRCAFVFSGQDSGDRRCALAGVRLELGKYWCVWHRPSRHNALAAVKIVEQLDKLKRDKP